MSRKPRFNIAEIPQHVIQRGHNREPCFYAEDDYHRYKRDLQEAAEKNRVQIHAYVLMTNHIHLLATPGEPYGITHMMQDLGRKFVRYMNYRYRRTGSLWAGRFKASLVETETYLLTCMRYIEMNPVRAGMVDLILPANDGHPVKRVNYATEVNHDKTQAREESTKHV